MPWITTLFNLLLPPRCHSCGVVVTTPHTLCLQCYNKLELIDHHCCCQNCGYPHEQNVDECLFCIRHQGKLINGTSALVYTDIARKMIINFKDNNATEKLEFFTNLMVGKLSTTINFTKDNLIIPIPVHKLKRLRRGYNQSELLANKISNKLGVPYCHNVLISQHNKTTQKHLSKKQRQQNLQTAFTIKNKQRIIGKDIILLDDVWTTGSTFKAAINLLAAHANSIQLLSLARVKLGSENLQQNSGP
jgi:ComF family protein